MKSHLGKPKRPRPQQGPSGKNPPEVVPTNKRGQSLLRQNEPMPRWGKKDAALKRGKR